MRHTAFGVMDIDTDVPDPAASGSTNFAVARMRQDVLRRSTVGLLYTGRSGVQPGGSQSQAFGVDGTFSFFNFLTINSYWAKTDHAGRGPDNQSYRGQLVYAGDRYGLQLEQLGVGEDVARDAMDAGLGVVVDRAAGGPVLIMSSEGGMEIEVVAHNTPEKIFTQKIDAGYGLQPFQVRKLAHELGKLVETVGANR